jgi:hypothetical protein
MSHDEMLNLNHRQTTKILNSANQKDFQTAFYATQNHDNYDTFTRHDFHTYKKKW